MARLRTELTLKGYHLPPVKAPEEHFDSNCITPGTPFMDRLAKCLHYYIHDRLNNDPGWRNIEVLDVVHVILLLVILQLHEDGKI